MIKETFNIKITYVKNKIPIKTSVNLTIFFLNKV